MNKFELVVVFLCGLISALFLPYLRSSVESLTNTINDSEILGLPRSGLLLFSEDGHRVDLMEEGYLTKIKFETISGNTALSQIKTTEHKLSDALTEAKHCLKIGKQFLRNGRIHKARKLFERAVILAPSLPQALLALGEFVEEYKSDVMLADQLYLRALTIAPTDSRAIRNRIRTKDLVAISDRNMLEAIESKRVQLSGVPLNSPALKRIQSEAYMHHIHHTVAIEGNTMTLQEIRTILETGQAIGGKSVVEHSEVVGVDSALQFINSSLLHRVGDITLQDILNIHMRVLGHTDPPAAGKLRTTQVVVGSHVPPPPERLASLMHQFIEWLNDPASTALHPVRYAALAHFHLVDIHPFIDGNGRTARLLMNFLLLQAGYPPIIIRHQDRLQYYDTLQAGHEGDTRPFVRFVSHCTEKTLDVYLWATRDAIPGISQASDSSQIVSKHIGIGSIERRNIEQGPGIMTPVGDLTAEARSEVYSRYSARGTPSINPEYVDDLGKRFGGRSKEEDSDGERISGPAVHQWLTGGGSDVYSRKSTYYRRYHLKEGEQRGGTIEASADYDENFDDIDEPLIRDVLNRTEKENITEEEGWRETYKEL